MTVNIYTIGKKQLIGTYKARNSYDSVFYFRDMPILSTKTCKEILSIVSPNFKVNSETLVLENVESGHIGIQDIYRNGTILNF